MEKLENLVDSVLEPGIQVVRKSYYLIGVFILQLKLILKLFTILYYLKKEINEKYIINLTEKTITIQLIYNIVVSVH